MGTVETFDHTADVGLRVRAATLDDLFRAAAEGMADYIVANRFEIRVVQTLPIRLTAHSPADLLVGWLNELIFLGETRHLLFSTFAIQVDDEGRTLVAEVGGEPIDRDRHVLDHEVKAVTHHGLTLERQAAGWVAELILDI